MPLHRRAHGKDPQTQIGRRGNDSGIVLQKKSSKTLINAEITSRELRTWSALDTAGAGETLLRAAISKLKLSMRANDYWVLRLSVPSRT